VPPRLTHQQNKKETPPGITHRKITRLERLWLRPNQFYKSEMRKNERAMVMANPVLHKLEDDGNHPS
jgi:hypothetical protein